MEAKTSFTIILISSIILIADASRNLNDIHTVQHDINIDITEFCKKTTNPALCAQTIKPHFLKKALDPFKALDAEIEATLDVAKKTLADIKTLEKKPDITKSDKGSFDVCKDQYKSILDAIKETKDAIAKKDIITIKFKFSAVLSYQGTCKDAFEGGKNPFVEDSDNVYNLGGNCLDIIADMEKAQGPPKLPIPVPVPKTATALSSVIGTVS